MEITTSPSPVADSGSINSSAKPTYAAVVAMGEDLKRSLELSKTNNGPSSQPQDPSSQSPSPPPSEKQVTSDDTLVPTTHDPAIIANSSSSTLPAKVSEGLKLSPESSKCLIGDGPSSSLQLRVAQSPYSLSENETPLPTSQQEQTSRNGQQLSANTHGTTRFHNSSIRHNTPRSAAITTNYRRKFHNSNVGPQHHGINNQNRNTRKSFHGRNNHPPSPTDLSIFPGPPLLPPSPASYSYPPYFPQPPVMPPYEASWLPVPPCTPFIGGPLPFPQPFVRAPYVPQIWDYPMNVVDPDLDLQAKIVNQVNYYFSFDNLIKDDYLKNQMDREGWVPITTIAGFRRMEKLTKSIQIITNALQASSVVEILGDKIRRRGDWKRWISSDSIQLS